MNRLWKTTRINDQDAINGFHLIVVPEIRTRIGAIRAQHGNNWRDFKAALKAEYFLEDTLRVTKHSFTKWVQMKNKGLSARELLREFEKKFDQLSVVEQQSMQAEKVELFVQAVDPLLQRHLVELLEDAAV